MPNAIKYKAGNLTGSLQKGNVALGISGSLGPTSTTGWYNGPNPPTSGLYQIIETAASGDPEVYSPQNDAELIRFARWKGATGADTGSVAAVLDWIGTQSNLMAINFQYESIVTDGLVLNLDAGFVGSYPTINTTWYDLSGNASNGILTNGPTFNSTNSGSIVFDGADDYINIPHNSSFNFGSGAFTISLVISSNQLETFTAYIKKGGPQEWQNSPAGWYASSGNGGGDLSWYWVFADGSQHTEITPFSTFSRTNDTFPLNFFTITRNSSGAFARSWNGSYETLSTVPIIGTSTWTANFDNSSDIWIGRGSQNYLNGSAAICRIYNRALSQAEILQNYNAQKSRYGL